jgi:hypothetical protein
MKHMPDVLVGDVVIIQGNEELFRDWDVLAPSDNRFG